MLIKKQIEKGYFINLKKWQDDEDDRRTQHQINIDYTAYVLKVETRKMQSALENTNNLLTILLNDPLVQKDQKEFIQKRIDFNRIILQQYEEEVVNA